ncbi:hypothetical protein B5P22_30950 [Pseudomonas tolaasii]|uniref:Uncharacterized protein n=1 Tax=Pseudomonas phage UFV-P2 TaxID=1235661 RepID=M4TI32_9CAUD|nr:hypothetical protein [Pseudomonas tolaasii]YP_007518481.1 hypothetical protein D305_gp39 [Pseudomonas phage UFV-P2]AGH62723.1 hypothetical protein [Pseudomonas phage UFV-P2]ARB31525.1 hypothetical protein B5P22_30950 [Pseudomonas tolaasii]
MYKVYFFTVDGGDGSSSVDVTDDPDFLASAEEEDPEAYGGNEGSYSIILTFPNKEAAIAAGVPV